ncbi:MAG: hypothetical protein HS130_07785 [Deltaproteobacteria bacterium]|nr:hypothetical protein [Deltaproteobacteria bacterium]MCL4873089.1 hypothetical protein [bacterium]
MAEWVYLGRLTGAVILTVLLFGAAGYALVYSASILNENEDKSIEEVDGNG